MLPEAAPALVVENDCVRAEIVPAQGGRVRSLYDRIDERQLLYSRPHAEWIRGDYLATLAGGWDQMFPNDDPWQGFPTHGLLWWAELDVDSASIDEVVVRCEFKEPRATIWHRYSLLPPPRRGLRLDTAVDVHEAVPVCLWATHPMLAVAPGWQIEPGSTVIEADRVDPGRAAPGPVDTEWLERVLTVPPPSQGWQEVLYAPGLGAASVGSRDGDVGTLVRWDAEFFSSLWVVTLSGFETVDLAVVLEPCTSWPYRLDEAAAQGTAKELLAGRTYRFWSSVESLVAE